MRRRNVRTWVRDMWFAPNPPERNPMVFFLVAVIAATTGPTAVGVRALPGSLAETPDLYGQLIAVAMFAGAMFSAVGILWTNRDTGLAFEMLGKILLGFGSIVYCAALLLTASSNPMLAAANAGGIGVGCFARVVQISFYVRKRRRESVVVGAP